MQTSALDIFLLDFLAVNINFYFLDTLANYIISGTACRKSELLCINSFLQIHIAKVCRKICADIIDIMVEYGAVNACNMDGGSSSVMLYRDTYGRYGEAGQVQMVNNYSLLQSQPRRMPNYWLVRAAQ